MKINFNQCLLAVVLVPGLAGTNQAQVQPTSAAPPGQLLVPGDA